MLDMLRVLIPFKEEFCFQIESRSSSVSAYHLELDVKRYLLF
uniref:Uncharacterized protein n=1 Tax=Aliivibrio wodanis TaxID=80852 RepID=A0A5Q4ZP34_9GAMM|nr:hypothetical protein AW0309160_01477 [Aliivibrio wodanis]